MKSLARVAISMAVVGCAGAAHAPPPAAPPPTPATVRATAHAATLTKLGLDVAHLPPLHGVPGASMKPLMDTFDDSLDACCEDCHVKDHLDAPTRAKTISNGMWEHFTRQLVLADGTPAYCDSCHDGSVRFLDRRDPEALRAWMRDNYVARLRTRDGAAVTCATCHGEPFEPHIVDRRWSLLR